jgi:hypothetical protein
MHVDKSWRMLLSMAVMERERWTDERLDKAFDRIDTDLREIRVETKRGFERVDKRFERIDDKFNPVLSEMNARFDSMQSEMNLRFEAVQRNMTLWFVSLFGTILASLVTAGAALISLT